MSGSNAAARLAGMQHIFRPGAKRNADSNFLSPLTASRTQETRSAKNPERCDRLQFRSGVEVAQARLQEAQLRADQHGIDYAEELCFRRSQAQV